MKPTSAPVCGSFPASSAGRALARGLLLGWVGLWAAAGSAWAHSWHDTAPVSASIAAARVALEAQLAAETRTLAVVPADSSAASPAIARLGASPGGNGALLASSFAPFRPKVRFYWDATHFYTESDGLPDRTRMPNLMVGITSWQQQVPLPVSYFGGTTNATNDPVSLGYQQPNVWKLPLVPVPAALPLSLSGGNFQRGAVALAADGVPIFNPANNTGRISYEIGELDTYGGHCGLGDDYHYHIAPVHLLPVLGNATPIAWVLDGYPMYGYVEPDGSARQALDAEGGHDHGGWGYHYHARGTFNAATGKWVPSAPYLHSAFHGTVVNYGGQVDPQPTASGLRASGTGGYTAVPVPGAVITAFRNPVALGADAGGNLVEDPAGTPSEDAFLLRYAVGGASYDLCWRLNRFATPRSVTMTWRLPTIAPTTQTYANSGNRLTAYPMAAPSLARLPDTGQTLDATPVFGEDSDYSRTPPTYLDHGNGTITDQVTGLMWQQVDNGESTWESAVANATNVRTGGYRDWRLPTPAEAFSLLNHNNNPALNSTYFANAASGVPHYWWTSDTYGASTTLVWCTNSGGGLGPKPKGETLSAGGSLRYHARYVRGARASNGHNYVNHLDGTITDLDTGLMWTQAPSAPMTWPNALAYAESLTVGGYADWRLPNVKELQSLVDPARATATTATTVPCLNRILFPAGAATAYWSSTSVRSATLNSAWLVEFGVNSAVPAASGPNRGYQGIVSYETHASLYPVFAVRTAAASAVTQGRAAPVVANLFPAGSRVSAVGNVTATDGTTWTVPAATQFAAGRKASDLYNEVTGVTPASIAAVDLNSVPIVEVDADGEVVTGYLFADNYFELYVNGTLVAVDPVPYTPFNSCVVRFRAKRPITYAIKLVDWEENLGLGSELNNGNAYHPGDGGFLASFSDGTVTDERWKAQSFYIAPLDNVGLVQELANGTHDSSAASVAPALNANGYALHYPLPANWFARDFPDGGWPAAATYSEAAVGVNDKPAYTRFPDQFSRSGAKFIWSSNLVLDNEVIVRYTTPASATQIVVETAGGQALSDGVSTADFGAVAVAGSSAQTFTMRNRGGTALTLAGATIDGVNSADFSIIAFTPGSLPAGGSATVTVRFSPGAAGARGAALHLLSSDPAVGAAFDLGLQGTGTTAPPVVTAVQPSSSSPLPTEGVWVRARAQAAPGTTLSAVRLAYQLVGSVATRTVFSETMAAAAVSPWTGASAATPWTVTTGGPPNTFSQATVANHGTGNPCGLVFDKGTTSLADSMVTSARLDASGASGFVEFWVAAQDLVAPNGWALQLSADGGATWNTRLAELAGSNHAYQQFHYDLTASERVGALQLRFQFVGYAAVAPARAPRIYLDDITVVTTGPAAPTVLVMLDDGLHQDGAAGDGVYGALIPAAAAGATVSYTVAATDASGGATTSAANSYTVLPAGLSATHAVVGPGYVPGGTVTVRNALASLSSLSGLVWSVLLPAGWSVAADAGATATCSAKPAVGTTGLAEWTWTGVAAGELNFTYTLNVPFAEVGDRVVTALAALRGLPGTTGAASILAQRDPLPVSRMWWHSADTDRNGRLSLAELTRVIELYNTRNGGIRTGAYRVDAGGEDGFAPDSSRAGTAAVPPPPYHSADADHDGRMSLPELTRVIELYNYRAGALRTGDYRMRAGTEDGFEPGPAEPTLGSLLPRVSRRRASGRMYPELPDAVAAPGGPGLAGWAFST